LTTFVLLSKGMLVHGVIYYGHIAGHYMTEQFLLTEKELLILTFNWKEQPAILTMPYFAMKCFIL